LLLTFYASESFAQTHRVHKKQLIRFHCILAEKATPNLTLLNYRDRKGMFLA